MSIVTRFAPSPTGFLHIGGARTALFNWLYARHTGGKFLLRIEDTDVRRSTEAAKTAIIDGLAWLEIDWDGEPVYQSARRERHAEMARELLAEDKAYRCYASPEELREMREAARREGRSILYDRRWRDRDPSEAPPGVSPAVRFKAPEAGETVLDDLVQGQVRVANDQLDDMVLLRADGTPTYMLSVVVDDHDMEITHVIRGDDHLTNAFRQTQLFRALGWREPAFAHIPLIHGSDGAKLSKRHGALAVDAYRDMGFLPEAMRNYLLRLGWSHGDDEIISTGQAIAWFDLDAIGRAPARFDMDRLTNLNSHYLRAMEDERLADLVTPGLAETVGEELGAEARARLLRGMPGLKPRATTLVDLAENAAFYARSGTVPFAKKAAGQLNDDARALLGRLLPRLETLPEWTEDGLERAVRDFIEVETPPRKLGQIAQPLRAALTGATVSPGIFEVLAALGRDESLARLAKVVE